MTPPSPSNSSGWRTGSGMTECFLSLPLCCAKALLPAIAELPPSLFSLQVMAPWRPGPSACCLYYCWLCSASTSECSAVLLPLLLLFFVLLPPSTSPPPHVSLRPRSSLTNSSELLEELPAKRSTFFLHDPGSCVPTRSSRNLAVGKDSW